MWDRLKRLLIKRDREAIALCVPVFLLLVAFLAGCGHILGPRKSYRDRVQTGIASWYGAKYHGRMCASGEVFDMYKLTAAHRELPFGTRVRVSNLDNGRSVIVRINDRGPFIRGRIIDLSYASARKIGMIKHGTARVRVEILD